MFYIRPEKNMNLFLEDEVNPEQQAPMEQDPSQAQAPMEDPNQQPPQEGEQPMEGQEDPNQQPDQTDGQQEEQPQEENPEEGMEEEGNGEDLIPRKNYINYSKLLYFNKFKSLLEFIDKTKTYINETRNAINFDDMENERQEQVILFLNKSLNDTEEQINFIVKKALPNLELEKVKLIFKGTVSKLNKIIDAYEKVNNTLKFKDDK